MMTVQKEMAVVRKAANHESMIYAEIHSTLSVVGRYDDWTMSAAVSVSMRVMEKPRRLNRADGGTKRTPKASEVKRVFTRHTLST